MSISIYDFDTRFAPFEAFAPITPIALFMPWTLLAAPVQKWAYAYFNTCAMMSETMLGGMVYPYAMQADHVEKHADTSTAAAVAT